jgi:hypothetical protein
MADDPDNAARTSSKEDLKCKVSQWLAKEGYPTEFQTASIFRRHHFRVFQGYHVRENDSETPREIDVLAMVDAPHEERPLIRCELLSSANGPRTSPGLYLQVGPDG